MKIITTADVKHIAFNLARESPAFDDTIPDYLTRFPNVLESCLVTPFQKFSQKQLYPSLVKKASILFYLMINNGKERVALNTLLVFLHRNGKWLEVDAQELYNFTVWVSLSPVTFKNEVVMGIEKFIKSHLVKLETKS